MTREPDPRHLDDLLREACGLNSKSQEVTTAGDKEADSYDETLLSANKATAFGSPTMRLVFFVQQTYHCARLWRTDLRDTWPRSLLVRGTD